MYCIGLSRLISTYFLSHNIIHSTSPTLFIRSALPYPRLGCAALHATGGRRPRRGSQSQSQVKLASQPAGEHVWIVRSETNLNKHSIDEADTKPRHLFLFVVEDNTRMIVDKYQIWKKLNWIYMKRQGILIFDHPEHTKAHCLCGGLQS